jgi:hypothetical protein
MVYAITETSLAMPASPPTNVPKPRPARGAATIVSHPDDPTKTADPHPAALTKTAASHPDTHQRPATPPCARRRDALIPTPPSRRQPSAPTSMSAALHHSMTLNQTSLVSTQVLNAWVATVTS